MRESRLLVLRLSRVMQASANNFDALVVGVTTGLLIQSAIGTGEPVMLEALNGSVRKLFNGQNPEVLAIFPGLRGVL